MTPHHDLSFSVFCSAIIIKCIFKLDYIFLEVRLETWKYDVRKNLHRKIYILHQVNQFKILIHFHMLQNLQLAIENACSGVSYVYLSVNITLYPPYTIVYTSTSTNGKYLKISFCIFKLLLK